MLCLDRSSFYVVLYFCITQTFRDIELYKRLYFVLTPLHAINVLQSCFISVTTVVVFIQHKQNTIKYYFACSPTPHIRATVFSEYIYMGALPKMKYFVCGTINTIIIFMIELYFS